MNVTNTGITCEITSGTSSGFSKRVSSGVTKYQKHLSGKEAFQIFSGINSEEFIFNGANITNKYWLVSFVASKLRHTFF